MHVNAQERFCECGDVCIRVAHTLVHTEVDMRAEGWLRARHSAQRRARGAYLRKGFCVS